MKIINGVPFSLYYIFINGIKNKTNPEILKLLGLIVEKEIIGNTDVEDSENYIYVSRDQNWVHIMDNFSCSLWYSTNFPKHIVELAKTYEIYTCSVGDIDLAFDFKYYNNGKKIREYVVESPNLTDEIIKTDYGQSLNGEQEGLKKSDQLDRVLFIAQSLGIKLDGKNGVQCYKIENLNSFA